MASLLEGALKQSIASAFKGKLTLGTLRRVSSTTVDSKGNPVPGTASTFTFEGIREDFSLFSKANSGIPETDVKILVLLGSLNPVTTIKKDDVLYLSTPWLKWYKVRRILAVDPAGASCSVQAYEIPDPT
jgi:hypothetical protein